MTEKEMKKLTRYQLLELLILQTSQVEALQNQVADLQKQLHDRSLQIDQIGSLAEASVYLSGVMQAAQTAVELFQSGAQERIAAMEAEAAKEAARILEHAQQQAQQILADAQKKDL